jgi:hypothetical protein
MKSKITLLLLSIFTLASCGTGTTLFLGPDGIEIIPPAQNIVIPVQPIVEPSK